ncbi:hypothetical protein SFR_3294 [Streptomyces sp. FR-008]|nr:hypothetical protein SFR_3294 [Streptomyces sp. FR-008]
MPAGPLTGNQRNHCFLLAESRRTDPRPQRTRPRVDPNSGRSHVNSRPNSGHGIHLAEAWEMMWILVENRGLLAGCE